MGSGKLSLSGLSGLCNQSFTLYTWSFYHVFLLQVSNVDCTGIFCVLVSDHKCYREAMVFVVKP